MLWMFANPYKNAICISAPLKSGPAEPRGPGGPLASPEFLRFSKVELSQSAPSNQGLAVVAPPDFLASAGP